MALPDGYRAARGDVVLVKATIKYDEGPDNNYLHLKIGISHSAMVERENVVELMHPHFDVNDEAMFGGEQVRIIALHESMAWLLTADGSMVSAHLRNLKRIPAEPIAIEAPPAPEAAL